MAKRSRRGLSKKWLPLGAVRGMGSNGKRAWKYKGEEYESMRSLIFRIPSKENKETGTPLPEVENKQ